MKSTHPLPLPHILNDLALLRAAGTTLSPDANPHVPAPSPVESSVQASYAFVAAARAAIRLSNSDKLDTQGENIDRARSQFDALLQGLRRAE